MGLYTARRLARRWGGDVVLLAREQAAGSLAEVRLPQQRGALST
jgi:signal transduction histidine kinase